MNTTCDPLALLQQPGTHRLCPASRFLSSRAVYVLSVLLCGEYSLTLSLSRLLFPGEQDFEAEEGVDIPVRLRPGCVDQQYLAALDKALDQAAVQFPSPDLIFYNAGASWLGLAGMGWAGLAWHGLAWATQMRAGWPLAHSAFRSTDLVATRSLSGWKV